MKDGFMTKEEAKFFGKLVSDELPLNGVFKTVAGWFMPTLLDTMDNKFADRVPEPWQSNIETLVTKTYDAMQDKVVTEEEANDIAVFCADVMNTHIDIPWFNEDDEAVMFIAAWQFLASVLRKVVKEKSE